MLFVQRSWTGSDEAVAHTLNRIDRALVQAGYSVDRSDANRIEARLGNVMVRAGANAPVGALDAEFFVTVKMPAPDGPDSEQLLPLEEELHSSN